MNQSYARKLIQDLFKASFITFILFLVIEQFEKGFVSNYFNLSYLLILVIISGMISILLPYENQEEKDKKPSKISQISVFFISLILAGVIYYQTRALGVLAPLLALASLVIILIIAKSLMKPNND